MKKFFKAFKIILIVLVVAISAGLIYFNMTFPKVSDAKKLKVEITPERVERGKYLANHVTGCIDCHSKRDYTKFAGPVVPGTEGMGGEAFDGAKANIPGVIYAKNITPAGIGNWTDGELFRTITTGVTKDGVSLFPLMPYLNYKNLAQEDVYSIIAYIRSLKPIENKVPDRKLDFPLPLIVKTITTDLTAPLPSSPDPSNELEQGKYLANAAACIDCHTKMEKGQIKPGTEFAGGFTFCLGNMCVTSSNITPDKETGIGLLTKEQFIDKFKFYRDANAQNIPVGTGGNNTAMPWTQLCGMSDADLGAIYTFLRTVPPISNKIEKYSTKIQ